MKYNYNEVVLMKDNSIKAVYDADLEMLLKKLEVFDSVIAGKCHCIFCGRTITLENLDSIIPQEQTIAFSCSQIDCRNRLVKEFGV